MFIIHSSFSLFDSVPSLSAHHLRAEEEAAAAQPKIPAWKQKLLDAKKAKEGDSPSTASPPATTAPSAASPPTSTASAGISPPSYFPICHVFGLSLFILSARKPPGGERVFPSVNRGNSQSALRPSPSSPAARSVGSQRPLAQSSNEINNGVSSSLFHSRYSLSPILSSSSSSQQTSPSYDSATCCLCQSSLQSTFHPSTLSPSIQRYLPSPSSSSVFFFVVAASCVDSSCRRAVSPLCHLSLTALGAPIKCPSCGRPGKPGKFCGGSPHPPPLPFIRH